MIVRKRGESSGPKEDSVYFTAPAAFAVGRLERWRTSRLRNSHGEETGLRKKRRERGCGVGERLRDYWTLVYFVDIAAVPFFLLCRSSLFLTPDSPGLPPPPSPSSPLEAIKALSGVTV